MEAVVTLPNDLYERLKLKSEQLARTPDDLVSDLVEQFLSDAHAIWQAEFEALLARVRSRAASISPEEIEADIAEAANEAKEARRARRAP
jgi:predicted DNA-binding protein